MALLALAGGLAPPLAAWALGRAALRGQAAPHSIALAAGTVIESAAIFGLLAAGLANIWTVGALYACAAAAGAWSFRGARPLWPRPRWIWALALPYAALYLVHALAPEIQPDGVTYHLGLVSEYARLGRFTDRIDFYSILPQGMEMLFFAAFVAGKQSAAKVTHLVYLAAAVPLLFAVARKLEIPPYAAACAAALYACAPITGLTASSSYTDAALVFFTLASFWLVLHDRLALAGLAAGFCYSIKVSGGLAPVLVVLYALSRRRYRPALGAASAAVLAAAPWVLRAFLATGNPAAPLLNRWFPNPYFHASMEQTLSATWRAYQGFSWPRAPWDLAVTGRLQGIFGPAFLLLPVGLLALRKKAGRWCWAAGTLAGVPWLANAGARFLMPSIPFFVLALGMSLPRPAALAAAAVHAVSAWPQVLSLYCGRDAWRLRDLPWRAALGIETERDYLKRNLWQWEVADMINESLPPDAKVLLLMDAPRLYSHASLTDFWQSALAERMVDTLRVASAYASTPFYDQRAEWPEEAVLGIRYRLRQAGPGEWCAHEIRLYYQDSRIYPSPQWRLAAWPNPWEFPSALDDNLASRWRTWEPMRAGMMLEARFDRPQRVTSAVLASHTPLLRAPVELYTLGVDGKWKQRSAALPAVERPRENLRRDAVRHVKSAGFGYIVAPSDFEGVFNVGRDMKDRSAEWGLVKINERGFVSLYQIP
jgi:hypothetical protein